MTLIKNQAIFVKEMPKWFTGCFIVVNIIQSTTQSLTENLGPNGRIGRRKHKLPLITNSKIFEHLWKLKKKIFCKFFLDHFYNFSKTHCAKYHKSERKNCRHHHYKKFPFLHSVVHHLFIFIYKPFCVNGNPLHIKTTGNTTFP